MNSLQEPALEHRGWPPRTPLTRGENPFAPGQLRAAEREAVPGPGGELREQREPVSADQGPAPFHRRPAAKPSRLISSAPVDGGVPSRRCSAAVGTTPRICSRPPSTRTPVRAASSSYSPVWVKSASSSGAPRSPGSQTVSSASGSPRRAGAVPAGTAAWMPPARAGRRSPRRRAGRGRG